MKDIAAAFTYDLTGLDRSEWIERVEDLSDRFGDLDPVGPEHSAILIDAGRTLLVTFETVARIRKTNQDQAPIGWQFVRSHGWSSLTILADAETDWFRHPSLFGYFDRLIDDGFFDDFDRVLFYGAGASGYATAAFSVAAPDTRVLAIQPQATLAPDRATWDRRFPQTRRLDFSSRFGFAPMMVETAAQVSIIYDPSVIEDAMHASLFTGANTQQFICPFIGPNAERSFAVMDILIDLIEAAMDDRLTRLSFAELWRARQTHMPYLRTLLYRLDGDEDHQRLLARLCRKVSEQGNRPLFDDKLEELRAEGVTL